MAVQYRAVLVRKRKDAPSDLCARLRVDDAQRSIPDRDRVDVAPDLGAAEVLVESPDPAFVNPSCSSRAESPRSTSLREIASAVCVAFDCARSCTRL
jgi:hypothetical protein